MNLFTGKTKIAVQPTFRTWLKRASSRYSLSYRVFNILANRNLSTTTIIHVRRPGALGDVLMCTPALRAFRKKRPNCKLVFYTNHSELVKCLSYIDEVRPSSEAPIDRVDLVYEDLIPPRRHIARLFGDQLGVVVKDVVPNIEVAEEKNSLEAIPEKYRNAVVINRNASNWTPNKNWPTVFWRELVEKLVASFTVVDIGADGLDALGICSANYVDLRGKTSLRELVEILRASLVHVGPVSGPVHIAAALGVSSVVIYGGYEHPDCSAYPLNANLYTRLACSPCWMRTPCPIEKKCLTLISVSAVYSAIIDKIGSYRLQERV